MLLKTEKVNETKYILTVSFEGKKYEKALANYPDYIQEIFRDSYENKLFPKGKTPISVIEELHGDGLYREIFKKHFVNLYRETISDAKLNNVNLDKVSIAYFSCERIVFTLMVSCNQNASHNADEQKEIIGVLQNEFEHVSNIDKLVIAHKEKRDEFFWKDLQDVCVSYQQSMSQKLLPILSKIGVLKYNEDAIRININESNLLRSAYPLVETALFPCAVCAAALHEYIQDFTDEDEKSLKTFIFSLASWSLDIAEQLGGNTKHVLIGRLYEYKQACKNELLSGYSLYGQFGMNFDRLKSWSQSHQVKCAHLLCDHIAYIEHFGQMGTYEDLDKLRPIVVNNSKQTLKNYMELYEILHTTADAIFMTVRGALNGGRKSQWRAKGLCQHCGREFKKTLFGSKCPVCKEKKDY